MLSRLFGGRRLGKFSSMNTNHFSQHLVSRHINTNIPATKHCSFSNNLVILGFGSIGQGTLPLILKHIDIPLENVTIVTKHDKHDEAMAAGSKYGVKVAIESVTQENYKSILSKYLRGGDFLVNLTVECDSQKLFEYCHDEKILYTDTVIDVWGDIYVDTSLPLHERTNYIVREQSLITARKYDGKGTTALLAHGANPGLVSHFMKQGMLNLGHDIGLFDEEMDEPTTRSEWAKLARRLGIETIHVAERDTQICDVPKKKGEFVNTWSVDGFVYEGAQPAELGWGTHEKMLPVDGIEHDFGSRCAICLNSPGLDVQVRTWTPTEGTFRGFLVTHNESMSMSHYLSLYDENGEDWEGNGKAIYRPTVHYAYHPCDDAMLSVHEFLGNNLDMESIHEHRLIVDDITAGIDELGILLGGKNMANGRAYWYGSQLEVNACREMIADNGPTTLQVTATVLGGVVWCIENPNRGIVEAEQVDFRRILEIAQPYVEPVVGVYTDWNPLMGRSDLFGEDVDWEDPWQFSNVRCHQRTDKKVLPRSYLRGLEEKKKLEKMDD